MWGALADESAGQIASAIAIAVLAFALGTFRRTITRRIQTRETRSYWSPFRARGVVFVISAFPPVGKDAAALKNIEPFGVVGLGEVLAILALQEHMKTLGVDNSVAAQTGELSSSAKRKNLVLVGGPTPNGATDFAINHHDLPVRFEGLGSRTRMRLTLTKDGSLAEDKTYDPIFRPGKPGQLVTDYGFVAQVSSPYDKNCRAVLLVGIYGAATAAAAQLVTSAHGVTEMSRVNNGQCLAIFRVDVGRNGEVSSPVIERCQPLHSATREA